jgi:hypothetical protein
VPDYDKLYSKPNTASWGLPAPQQLDPASGEFRDLIISFSGLTDPVGAERPPIRIVCCDVLRVFGVTVIDRNTFIFARRIEIDAKAALAIDRIGRDFDVAIVAQCIQRSGKPAPLPYTVLSEGADTIQDAVEIPPGAPAAGFRLTKDGRFEAAGPSALAKDLLFDGSTLALCLRSQFQVAVLTFTEDPVLALALATWTAALTVGSTRFADLAVDAQTLKGRIEASLTLSNEAMLAPALDYELYASQSKNMVSTLRDRALTLQTLTTAAEDDQRWIDSVKATLADKENDVQLTKGLEAMTERAVKSASDARAIASVEIRQQSATFSALRIDFEAGIKNWRAQAEQEAVLGIIKNIVGLAANLPAVVAGAPHIAAMPLADTAAALAMTAIDIAYAAREKLLPALAVPPDGSGGRLEVWEKGKMGDGSPRPPSSGSPTRSLSLPPSPLLGPTDDERGHDEVPFRLGEEPPPRVRADRPRIIVLLDDDDDDDSASALVLTSDDKDDRDDWSVMDETDPAKDFVLVGPSKEGKAFAKTYNAELKAAEKAKKKNKQLQDEILKGLKDAGKEALGIYEGVMKIVKIAAQAEELEKQSRKILASVDLAVGEAFASFEPTGLDVVTGGSQVWEELEVEISKPFDRMGELQDRIVGARQFHDAILKLIRMGRIMSEARLAVARANFDLAASRLRSKAARRSTDIFNNRLVSMENRAKRRAAMELLAFDRVLDAKRSAWLAMESYDRALRYYTLEKPDARYTAPRITASVDTFKERAGAMGERWVTSASMRSKPQPVTINFRFKDEELDKRVGAQGEIAFECHPSDPFFSGYYRIRIDEIAVLVGGLHHGGIVLVDVSTSGVYDDRMRDGTTSRFVSDAYRISYAYNGTTGLVISPGRIEGRLAEDFFKPTPFTKWTLRILDHNTQNPLSLKGATELVLTLQGNWSRRV